MRMRSCRLCDENAPESLKGQSLTDRGNVKNFVAGEILPLAKEQP